MKEAVLKNAALNYANFIKGEFYRTCFFVSVLTNALFCKSNLYSAHFAGSTLLGADLSDANIDFANFGKAEIDDCLMRFIPQFEFSESSINEMVEAAKKEYVSEVVSDLGLEELGLAIGEDIENIIIEVFSFGIKIGASNMLETINDTAALFNGDSVLNVVFDENTESVS